MLETLVWVLPRPRIHNSYKGGFPLHFEKKLLRLYGIDEKKAEGVLHPFGGRSEYGTRCDLNPDVKPDYVCDAHAMPFADETWSFIIFDPPYSNEESKRLYGMPPIKLKKAIAEAVRVLKFGGYIALYHRLWLPRPDGCTYHKRILVTPGQWHETRTCHVFQKTGNKTDLQ
jgi:hypothetical protein